MQAKSGSQVPRIGPRRQVGALTLLMYPSENRPAPQAMTGTMALRKGWRGTSTATASCWAEVSDSADFFLRKLSMMRQTDCQAIEEAKPGMEEGKARLVRKQLKDERFQGAASQESQGGV